MKIKITPRMIGYLTSEISRGRPLAALLRATEYLEAHDPIFLALIKKAQPALASDQYESVRDVVASVSAGQTMSSLTSEAQLRVRVLSEVGRAKIPQVITMPSYQTSIERRAARMASR